VIAFATCDFGDAPVTGDGEVSMGDLFEARRKKLNLDCRLLEERLCVGDNSGEGDPSEESTVRRSCC
jgi:hypothetical protein